MPQAAPPIPAKRAVGTVPISTDWPRGAMDAKALGMSDQLRLGNRTGAVFRRTGSATCLAWALQRFARVETLGFDYGQRHAIELECRDHLLAGIKSLRADWAEKLGENHTLDDSDAG